MRRNKKDLHAADDIVSAAIAVRFADGLVSIHSRHQKEAGHVSETRCGIGTDLNHGARTAASPAACESNVRRHPLLYSMITRFLRLAALGCAAFAAAHAALPTKPVLTLDTAKKVAAAAEAAAVKNHFTMVIVVVDDGGNIVLLERMDGTQLGSIEVAKAKAATALKFKRPTKAYQDVVANGNHAVLSVPGIIAIEGGAPLLVNGEPVGALGVSGMKPNEDGVVMQVGVDAFQELVK